MKLYFAFFYSFFFDLCLRRKNCSAKEMIMGFGLFETSLNFISIRYIIAQCIFNMLVKMLMKKYQLSNIYFHNREHKCEVYPITLLCPRFVLAVCSSSSQEWCAVAIFALRNWIACCTCVALFQNIQKNIVKSRIITENVY